MSELLRFSHDRDSDFGESCDRLNGVICRFAEQEGLEELYGYFQRFYSLPKQIVMQDIKRILEREYRYQENPGFSRKLFPAYIIPAAAALIGFLLYSLISSRKEKPSSRRFRLIIDGIASREELYRFSKLIDMFGKKEVLVLTSSLIEEPGYNLRYCPLLKLFDRGEVANAISRELARGLILYIKLSLKLKVNITAIATRILRDQLFYGSIFKRNFADYCLQERHYNTNPIKNHYFHEYGGKCSATIQKNIYQAGGCGFFFHVDTFFALGRKTVDRAFRYGAEIKDVLPVGSMFMEYYRFDHRAKGGEPCAKFDIVFIGVNYYPDGRYIAYSSFTDDYFESYRWLARFSRERPGLKIGIKHHANYKGNSTEEKIVRGTSIESIDKDLNSYRVAFDSKCALTFCSTLGYELIAHGKPALFLDPGRRNTEILPDNGLLDDWRVTTYEDFKNKLDYILNGGKIAYKNAQPEDLCMDSKETSQRIFSYLTKNNVSK